MVEGIRVASQCSPVFLQVGTDGFEFKLKSSIMLICRIYSRFNE